MKKAKMLRISTILAGSLLTATMAWAATDYTAMTNEELAAQRGSMKQSTVEERSAFQNEWQNRVQKMSPEEKQKAMGQPENAPRDGSGQKNGKGEQKQERNQERVQQRQDQGSGSGMGGGNMGSSGGGMSRGSMGGGGRR
ncbi:MAG: hypothetical protein KJ555_11470 [Proteobacteria bacterium]|nr:hypothetical protein [Pseudomonadota bacterium]MBU4119369.1 hypothetical protein [Pseudomonadota bacterium]